MRTEQKTQKKSQAFANTYAKFFDVIYHDKDYAAECDYLISLINTYAKRPVHALLDTAAGTGSHAIVFAQRGYQVTGSDLSEGMIATAKQKAHTLNLDIEFHGGLPMQNIDFKTTFDVIVCMFSSIDYLYNPTDLFTYLKKTYAHLNPGGVFICDFWNGHAVTKHFDPYRKKKFYKDEAYVERISTNTVDPLAQTSHIRMESSYWVNNDKTDEIVEDHYLRFFYLQEMKNYMTYAGYSEVHLRPFMKLGAPVTEDEWNISAIGIKNSNS